MKRHKKGAKGRLLSTVFEPATRAGFCCTCGCRGIVPPAIATQQRTQRFEFWPGPYIVQFCNEHIAGAIAAYEAK